MKTKGGEPMLPTVTRDLWEYLKASQKTVVLYGMGNGADKILSVLAERGIPSQILPRYRMTNFSHTMGGGYTAGYYSYMWAEVLDADAFDAFAETGDIFNQEVAAKFRNYILTPGGIDDGMVMYKNFRGREPKIDALLRNRGI